MNTLLFKIVGVATNELWFGLYLQVYCPQKYYGSLNNAGFDCALSIPIWDLRLRNAL